MFFLCSFIMFINKMFCRSSYTCYTNKYTRTNREYFQCVFVSISTFNSISNHADSTVLCNYHIPDDHIMIILLFYAKGVLQTANLVPVIMCNNNSCCCCCCFRCCCYCCCWELVDDSYDNVTFMDLLKKD